MAHQSSSHQTFQLRWLNLILHLTAVIAVRKRELTSVNIVRMLLDVFLIITLEGVLSIVSIPLYFFDISDDFSSENEFGGQYHIRRFLTFLLIGGAFFTLLAKFLLITGLSAYYNIPVVELMSQSGWWSPLIEILGIISRVSLFAFITIGFWTLFLTL